MTPAKRDNAVPLPLTPGHLKITFSCVHRSPGTCCRSPAHSLYKSWQAGSLHVDQSSQTVNLPLFFFPFFSHRSQTDLGGKQSVINPMGMFTVSSGIPMNQQRRIKGSENPVLQDIFERSSGSKNPLNLHLWQYFPQKTKKNPLDLRWNLCRCMITCICMVASPVPLFCFPCCHANRYLLIHTQMACGKSNFFFFASRFKYSHRRKTNVALTRGPTVHPAVGG